LIIDNKQYHTTIQRNGISLYMPSSDEITRNNPARIFGKKMFVFDTIDSTNNCARLLAESGTEEGTVVYAEEQTSGRGYASSANGCPRKV
jgi:hypothetical protein